jgi:hypothetical protein
MGLIVKRHWVILDNHPSDDGSKYICRIPRHVNR